LQTKLPHSGVNTDMDEGINYAPSVLANTEQNRRRGAIHREKLAHNSLALKLYAREIIGLLHCMLVYLPRIEVNNLIIVSLAFLC
jgi:hypothetical protein